MIIYSIISRVLYNWLVVEPTLLKNMRTSKLDHFPKDRGENKKCLKPPTSNLFHYFQGLKKYIHPRWCKVSFINRYLKQEFSQVFWNSLFLFTLNSVLKSSSIFFGDLPLATPRKMPENSIGQGRWLATNGSEMVVPTRGWRFISPVSTLDRQNRVTATIQSIFRLSPSTMLQLTFQGHSPKAGSVHKIGTN